MDNLIAWGIGLGIIALMYWALRSERRRVARRTVEEYERDVREGAGTGQQMLRAGLIDVERMLRAEVREAEIHLQDQNAGRTTAEKKPGDSTPPESDSPSIPRDE